MLCCARYVTKFSLARCDVFSEATSSIIVFTRQFNMQTWRTTPLCIASVPRILQGPRRLYRATGPRDPNGPKAVLRKVRGVRQKLMFQWILGKLQPEPSGPRPMKTTPVFLLKHSWMAAKCYLTLFPFALRGGRQVFIWVRRPEPLGPLGIIEATGGPRAPKSGMYRTPRFVFLWANVGHL